MIRGVSLFFLAISAWAWQDPARLDQTEFPAQGEMETLLHVSQPGRYSLQVESGQGVALELVDAMGGPILMDGAPGEHDGRVDGLLDVGAYKVRLYAHKEGSGTATLSVSPFNNRREGKPPTLWDNELITRELGDLEQHAFWLIVEQPEVLRLEIMGRNLSDARLWYPGDWLTHFQPAITTYEALPGRPMTHIEFHHQVPQGMYLLTCYGGPKQAWADENETHPLYLRRGLPVYGAYGSHQITISPFGRESFITDGKAVHHEILRADKRDTELNVRDFIETGSRYGYGDTAAIHKKSRDSFASLRTYPSGKKWVTLKAKPGDVIRYRHFALNTDFYINQSGRYWVGSIHGFQARDMFDVTATLSKRDPRPQTPIREISLFLDQYNRVARRTNLVGELELFLNVRQEGTYVIEEVAGGSAQARYRLEPYMLSPPNNYRPPAFSDAGAPWPLTKGLHRLTIKPKKKGILQFVIHHGEDPLVEGEEVGLVTPNQVGQQIRWPNVQLGSNSSYRFALNNRNNTPVGGFARPLPLDLNLGLPLSLVKDESITLSIKSTNLSALLFEHEGFSLMVDGLPAKNGDKITSGRHALTVTNVEGKRADCYLGLAPFQQRSTVPQQLSDGTENLPVLSATNPLYLDYVQNDHKAFMLEVDQPGLYRIETSGRLATSLAVRTKITVNLANANSNGVGRNALIQQYLRPGLYLVSAYTTGNSQGRAGLHLNRAELLEGGNLQPDQIARISLTGDAAIRYQVHIQDPGGYQLETLGLGKRFPSRFEDADGYPLLRPGGSETLNSVLAPGNYAYYSLPAPVASRRLTRLTPIAEARLLEGKGPHPILLNQPLNHLWRKGGPDRYTLVVTAPIEATVQLTAGMQLTLLGSNKKVLETSTPTTATGLLPAGTYVVEVRRLEEDDRFPYSVGIKTSWLAPGVSQTVSRVPATVRVSLEASMLVDLFSVGDTDVKAKLSNTNGFVSEADDRENDWNFHFSQVLPAGQSTLDVSHLGPANGPVTFHLEPRVSTQLPEQNLPFQLEQALGRVVFTQPFTVKEDGLYHFAAEGDSPISLALSQDDLILGQERESLHVPLRAGTYELLIWAEGHSAQVRVSASRLKLSRKTVNAGTRLKAGHYQLSSSGPASFHLQGQGWFSPDWQHPLQRVANRFVNLHESQGWLRLKATAQLTQIDLSNTLSVPLDEPRFSFQLSRKDKRPMLLEAVSVTSRPGCAAADKPDWQATLTHGNRAWTSLPGKGDYSVTVWKTEASKIRDRFELIPHLFEEEAATDLNDGVAGTLAPGAARTVHVATAVNTELILGKGLIVADHGGERVHAMIGAISGNLRKIHSVRGDRLILYNTGPTQALYRVAVTEQPNRVTRASLSQDTFFERVFNVPGTLRLSLAGSEAGSIFLAGDEATGVLLSARGLRMPLDPEGTPAEQGELVVHHGPGLVTVRLADREEGTVLSGPGISNPEKSPGAFHALNGKPRTWTVELDEPTWLRIDTDVAGKTMLSRDNLVLYQSASADPLKCSLEAFLPSGTYGLHAWPLPGQPAQGTRHLQRIRPQLLDENMAARLIADSEVHVYRFNVAVAGKVGVGLKTESDRLMARLFDASSQLLASGPFVLRQLEAGDYLLVVEARGAPVSYQPLVYGNNGPGSRIPDEVLLQYVKE